MVTFLIVFMAFMLPANVWIWYVNLRTAPLLATFAAFAAGLDLSSLLRHIY